jgi:SET domain-containing protein
MTAKRDIKKDEEITFDYATSEANTTKGITDCCCGEYNCR